MADSLFINGAKMFALAHKRTNGRINVLIHAADWRDKIEEIKNNSFHHDDDFLDNIKQDAVSVSTIEI